MVCRAQGGGHEDGLAVGAAGLLAWCWGLFLQLHLQSRFLS